MPTPATTLSRVRGRAARIVTDLGSRGSPSRAALVVAVLIWRFRWLEAALFMAISSQAGTSPPRPEVRRPPGPASRRLVHLSSFSFPSGHLVGTLTLCAGVRGLSRYGPAATSAWQRGRFVPAHHRGRVSRIELAVHYTSD